MRFNRRIRVRYLFTEGNICLASGRSGWVANGHKKTTNFPATCELRTQNESYAARNSPGTLERIISGRCHSMNGYCIECKNSDNVYSARYELKLTTVSKSHEVEAL